MKYTGMKSFYGVLFIMVLVVTIYSVHEYYLQWARETNGVHAMMILSIGLLSGIGLYCFYRIHRRSFAMIQDDGVHVFSPKKAELTIIPWEKVKECKQVSGYGRVPYLMLVFQLHANYAKKPIAVYRYGLQPTFKEVQQHRLDECMDKLCRGKLTEEEFKQIPYLLLVPNLLLAPSKDHLVEHCLKMWKAKMGTKKKTEAASLS